MSVRSLIGWLVCVWWIAVPVPAQTTGKVTTQPQKKEVVPAKAAPGKATAKRIPFQDVKLKNGLRVFLAEDHTAPQVALQLSFDVGSRNEVPGKSGLAHLFEHMMFQGSENVGKAEHFMLIFENGGQINAGAGPEGTGYFDVLPANQLDLALFLESDRLRSLAINATNLENQRKTVQEERRQEVDNKAYGKFEEYINDTVYTKFPYKHPTYGSMDDLNATTVEDLKQFFKTYYAPNNAVLALAGDFNSAEALAKINKYFGDLPSGPPPPPVASIEESEQTAERRRVFEDEFAQSPVTTIVWLGPLGYTHDSYAMDMASRILGRDASSRLYQKLAKEQSLTNLIRSHTSSSRGLTKIQVDFRPLPGQDSAKIEQMIYDEIERLKTQGPEDLEMQKILTKIKADWALWKLSMRRRAGLLAGYALACNDPDLINTIEDKYAAVTKADIQRVMAKYMTSARRNVITVVPKPKSAASKPAGF